MGVLFDECARRGTGTTVRLDRPFDIAPVSYTHLTLPTNREV